MQQQQQRKKNLFIMTNESFCKRGYVHNNDLRMN